MIEAPTPTDGAQPKGPLPTDPMFVLMAKATKNTEGMPGDWPIRVTEGASDPKDGSVRMTRIEHDAHREKHKPAYDQWLAAKRLPQRKIDKRAAIDERTRALIEDDGFEYEGKRYSLSTRAQAKISAYYNGRDAWKYPIRVNAKDDASFLMLAKKQDIEKFYTAMVSTIRTRIDSGDVLKDMVNASTSTEALEKVVDDR